MAQSGLHGIVGLALSRAVGSNVSSASQHGASGERDALAEEWKKGLTFGFILGNILPDVDLLPLAITFLFNSELAMRMHRTATHSLLLSVPLILIGWLFLRGRTKGLVTGLGLGALTHSVLDIFLWFSSVDLLWPLGRWGIPSLVNLWSGAKLPRFVSNFLGALDYLAFALYFVSLTNIAKKKETDLEFLPRLRLFTALNLAFFALYTILSGVLSRTIFDIAHYAMFVLVFFPLAVYSTFKMRKTIETAL